MAERVSVLSTFLFCLISPSQEGNTLTSSFPLIPACATDERLLQLEQFTLKYVWWWGWYLFFKKRKTSSVASPCGMWLKGSNPISFWGTENKSLSLGMIFLKNKTKTREETKAFFLGWLAKWTKSEVNCTRDYHNSSVATFKPEFWNPDQVFFPSFLLLQMDEGRLLSSLFFPFKALLAFA